MSKPAEVGSGKTDEVDSSTGTTGELTWPRVALSDRTGRFTSTRDGASTGRESVQAAQDHAFPQCPGTHVDRLYLQLAHRRLRHHGPREQLVCPGGADALHLA